MSIIRLPNKEGTAIYRCALRYTSGTSDKVYVVSVHRLPLPMNHCIVYFEYGPAHCLNAGGTKTGPVTKGSARQVAAALVQEKQKKGYVILDEEHFEEAAASKPSAKPAARPSRPKVSFAELVEQMPTERRQIVSRFF